MKVYLCEQSDYDGQSVFRVFKDKEKAEYTVKQVSRLFEVKEKLWDLDRKAQHRFTETHPEIINNTKFRLYYDSEEHKKIEGLKKKVEKLLNEFGADSFYSQCFALERKVE